MKNFQKDRLKKKQMRLRRVRARVFGTDQKPRVAVFRSHKHFSIQLISDEQSKTLAQAADRELKTKKSTKKIDIAKAVGELLGDKALKLGVKKVVFDRRSNKYHGRVKALAEGVRSAGIKF